MHPSHLSTLRTPPRRRCGSPPPPGARFAAAADAQRAGSEPRVRARARGGGRGVCGDSCGAVRVEGVTRAMRRRRPAAAGGEAGPRARWTGITKNANDCDPVPADPGPADTGTADSGSADTGTADPGFMVLRSPGRPCPGRPRPAAAGGHAGPGSARLRAGAAACAGCGGAARGGVRRLWGAGAASCAATGGRSARAPPPARARARSPPAPSPSLLGHPRDRQVGLERSVAARPGARPTGCWRLRGRL
jgi:hypothetical protein